LEVELCEDAKVEARMKKAVAPAKVREKAVGKKSISLFEHEPAKLHIDKCPRGQIESEQSGSPSLILGTTLAQ
jgi:hypothetical protein